MEPSAAPVAPLPDEWQDWITGNVVRGCDDGAMLEVMTQAGFEAGYARTAIAVVRAMTERVRREQPSALVDYTADPIRLPQAAAATAADRTVAFGFVLRNPNVALLEGLLSDDECDRLIRLSAGKLRRSEVVDQDTGGYTVSQVRTSEGTWFERGENAVVQRLEARIAALTGLPIDHGEPLQILHYGTGGEYLPHHDYFDPRDAGTPAQLEAGGQRVATVVVYLNDVARGGETGFPELDLTVSARRGSAVYFEYHNTRGQLDPRCLHAGNPVLAGEKWIATKWLRERPYARR